MAATQKVLRSPLSGARSRPGSPQIRSPTRASVSSTPCMPAKTSYIPLRPPRVNPVSSNPRASAAARAAFAAVFSGRGSAALRTCVAADARLSAAPGTLPAGADTVASLADWLQTRRPCAHLPLDAAINCVARTQDGAVVVAGVMRREDSGVDVDCAGTFYFDVSCQVATMELAWDSLTLVSDWRWPLGTDECWGLQRLVDAQGDCQ
eukprot:TRINITY_DN37611_c0_g1_i1.p1 TRINITY_DN37611_c0_g1~~TRINITY_DN37611_c0_g1_i1.p1  ORF type:complete len:207 (+),score=27.83 TRINITY_DN37611_c0_g1_i1:56-676(+)